jgi:hypothetical protein
MKREETWKWRIRWGGRWSTWDLYRTEAEIRREHPEAIKVEGTMRIRESAETPEELEAAWRATDTRHGIAYPEKNRPSEDGL